MIYFIQAGKRRAIKIGYAKNTQKRLVTLQVGCPDELRMIFQMPGDMMLEFDIHKKFDHGRIRGEWFDCVEDIAKFVCDIKSGKPMDIISRASVRMANEYSYNLGREFARNRKALERERKESGIINMPLDGH